jgi:hypothetical protein
MIIDKILIGTREEMLYFFSSVLPYSKEIEELPNSEFETQNTILSQLVKIGEGFGIVYWIKNEWHPEFGMYCRGLKYQFVKVINNSKGENDDDE